MSQEKTWKTLLIAEDQETRESILRVLEGVGDEVLTALDGETGLQLCLSEGPRIVVMELPMPGFEGLEVLRKIKAMDLHLEVIVIAAADDLELAVEALREDASDYLIKPVSNEALAVAGKRAKDRYRTRREGNGYTELIEERWMSTAEELAKTFNFQQMLIESSLDGILACNGEGKVIICNHRMLEMLEYAREEVVGKLHLNQLFAPGEEEKFFKALSSPTFGEKNQLFLYETTLMAKTGAKVPAQVSAAVLFEEDRNVGVVGFFRDLTSIRLLTEQFADEARMLHQDKMISLGRLAASVVHEINNPLAGLLNYVRLMLKIINRGPLNPEATQKFQGYLTLMDGELSRCSGIVSNLLAFSRKSPIEFCEVRVNDLITKSLTLSDHKLVLQNITVQSRFSAENPTVMGDFNQLQQCLINLIFNAADAMPQGGVLTIECTLDQQRQLVSIRVQDTGRGIRKEDLPFIFDPFYTTKKEAKGVGLGLSTVYGIIDRHKGTITVESELGKGAKFVIKLPFGKELRTLVPQ